MSIEQSPQSQSNLNDAESFPHSKTDYGLVFVGMNIGNLIGDKLFETGFSPVDAPPRAAIAVGLLFGAKKAWQHLKS